jgi:hypothetical protein
MHPGSMGRQGKEQTKELLEDQGFKILLVEDRKFLRPATERRSGPAPASKSLAEPETPLFACFVARLGYLWE